MTTQISQWLQAQNLEQYADGFNENEITLEDLPDLTDADLKELGVAAMGTPQGHSARGRCRFRGTISNCSAGNTGGGIRTKPTVRTSRSIRTRKSNRIG